MKKNILVIVLLAVISISCQENIEPINNSELTFTASISDNIATKTTLDGTSVKWVANDEITINGVTFVATPKSDATKATFTKKNNGDSNPTGTYTAYYPASIYNSGTPTLPADQTYGSFNINPMYATSSTQNLEFKNICAVLAVKVKSTDMSPVKKIKVSSSNKAMSGAFTVTDNTAVMTSPSTVANTVTLNCGDGVATSSDGTTFYIAIPAQTYKNLKIELSSDGSTYTQSMTTKKDQDIAVAASTIYSITFGDNSAFDLSAGGTANCYIVSSAGKYKIKAVQGNSTTSVGDVKGVKVLWETFGTDTAPSVGDLIKSDVSYKDGYITFSTNDTYKEGNALIAAYSDADCTNGNVLWSWHIWLTDQPAEQVYNNNAGTVMDRNLGATNATKGDVGAIGLLYQWGRKDPFMSGCQISYPTPIRNQRASSVGSSWPTPVFSDANTGTIDYAIKNPMLYIRHNESNKDWYYTGSSSTDDTRWTSTKTKYDPCPNGWRVPDGGKNGLWAKAFGTSESFTESSNWDKTNRGIDYGTTDKTLGTGSIWYPAVGFLSTTYAALNNAGLLSYYWSCTPVDYYIHNFYFCYDGRTSLYENNNTRSQGMPVRCVKE